VGYHARAGHPRGTIAHTYTGAPTLTTLDGRPTGEYGINGLYLGALGIPVGMVAGDDALAEEVAEWLPWAERVVVKRGVSWQAADSLHPSAARDLVRDGARRAVERAGAVSADAGHLDRRPRQAAPAARASGRRSRSASTSDTPARRTTRR
jgi:D-amino peptidase